MCLAVPVKIVEINGMEAVVEFQGVRTRARLDLMQDCKVGDYVLIHAGFVIQKLDEKAAKESMEAWQEIIKALQQD